ncbi:ATP-binding protein [Streptomyces sp. NPDC047000]|uniref:ATP-binding protein n=1 Tax=Streptomyces sp. NPDC047000 TaxID=3155474 RepID=UPI00340DABD1
MSTKAVDAPVRGFANRWPFRRKLNLLVGVPLAVVAILLAYLITDQVGQSSSARTAAQLVRDSAQVAVLADRVESEHQEAVLLSVRHEAAGSGGKPSLASYRKAQARVDAQIEKVRRTFGDRLPDTEAQALKEVSGLSSLRGTVEQSYLPASNIDPAYTNAAKVLIDGLGLDRNESLSSTFTGNMLDSLLRANAAHASFETSVFSATTGDTNALIEFTSAVGSYDLYSYQADRFSRFASEAQADELSGIEHSTAQRDIAEAYAELQVDPTGLQKNNPAEIRAAFRDAMDDYPSYPQQAGSRLRITTSLVGQIADRADRSSSDAQWRAGLLLGFALIAFALWIGFAIAVRRSVVRPVQALTGAAQQVAEVAGRELARVADDDAEDDGPPRLREMPVTAQDEIGELAEAFNHVQTTAAALLERQVVSRRNVAEMFGNVGRRVSNLTTRQLALIDAVERGETDPALLERLYSIDHIAVRLRRNADSLMLLAGIRETVLDAGPTPLSNVVRAALGQIEGYQRVRLHAGTEAVMEPDVIGDLTLMVAELLENAVSFSPAGSPVEVTVRSGEDGTFIVIADHGLGMSPERIAEENARLVRRERLDVVPTKVLGLFVVGTLARRWNIAVTLSRTPGGGVTAEVSLPSSLLLTMSSLATDGMKVRNGKDGAYGTDGTGRYGGPPSLPAAPSAERALPAAPPVPSAPPALPPAPAPAAVVPSPRAPEPAPSGPVPSTALHTQSGFPDPAADPDHPDLLPRRVPRREAAGTDDDKPPLIPRARSGVTVTEHSRTEDTTHPHGSTGTGPARPGGEGAGSGGSGTLRRRVRGATLRTTVDAAAQAARQAARPADADAVRDALDEFEEAVARANRDSALAAPRPPHAQHDQNDRHDQNDLPEGAEQ